MLAVPLFFVLLVWYLIICYKWKKNIFDYLEKIPGMKWYPVFGTTYAYVGVNRYDILYKFAEVAAKYGPFFKSWNGNVPEVNVMKPEHLQVIMKSSSHTTKGPFYDSLFPWIGEGLFLSEGAKWFMQRKLVTPTFHFKILDGFMESFEEKSQLLIKELGEQVHGKYFNIIPAVSCCTLSIICEAAMGVPLTKITDKPLEYIKNVHDITELAMWRYWNPCVIDPIFYLLPQGRLYKRVLKDLHAFSSKVLTYRKEQKHTSTANQRANQPSDDGRKERLSFMDLIMDTKNSKNEMSDSDLQSLVDTFLVAGYETTATNICWVLFLLGNHPDIQEKVYEELRAVLKDKPSPTTREDLNRLEYLECVVKETMRLYPVIPFITRKLTDDVQISDYKVPKGTQAILHVFQVHRDAEHFPEPNKFDPDRFLPENAKNRHPFAYIPFSAGPRNCMGMRFAMFELKLVLATILKRFKVTSLKRPEEMKLFAHIMLRPQTGIDVKLEYRDESHL